MKYLEQVNPQRLRKKNSGCPVQEARELLNGYEVLLWSDENVLSLDRGGHCTTT